jgi:hypothetical protein
MVYANDQWVLVPTNKAKYPRGTAPRIGPVPFGSVDYSDETSCVITGTCPVHVSTKYLTRTTVRIITMISPVRLRYASGAHVGKGAVPESNTNSAVGDKITRPDHHHGYLFRIRPPC